MSKSDREPWISDQLKGGVYNWIEKKERQQAKKGREWDKQKASLKSR